MKRLIPIVAASALLAAGLLAALVVAPSAKAWGPTDLPPGWQVHHITAINVTTCAERYQIFEYTNGAFVDVSPELCTDSPTYQHDFDAWIDARYTAPVTTATAPATTTVVITTTTTVPADTTTTAPASTDPAPPPPAPAPTTTTAACDVQCQIADLQSQIVALRGELTQLVRILQTWPDIDPGILSALMALTP